MKGGFVDELPGESVHVQKGSNSRVTTLGFIHILVTTNSVCILARF